MNWKGKVIAEKLTDIKNTGAVGFFWNLEFHLLLKKKIGNLEKELIGV